jgi:glucokinase
VLNPEAGQFVGVDFYGDEILAIAVDFAQNRLEEATRPIRRGDSAEDVLSSIEQAIDHVAPRNHRHLLGIGVGTPGPVDREKGIAVEYRYIKGFRNVPITAPLSERFRAPVYIENAANAMALAELWFGQGRGANSLVCIWVRSGIGAGIIVDRRLYSGTGDAAGEIGFWRCPVYSSSAKGVPRLQKRSDLRELEEIASVRAIRESLQAAIKAGQTSALRNTPRKLTTARICQAYEGGDRLTHRVVTAAAGSLGWAIAHLSFCLAPERVILAGPLATLGEGLLQPIRGVAAECFADAGIEPPPIALSTLGPFSGALGAAALCVHQWGPARA